MRVTDGRMIPQLRGDKMILIDLLNKSHCNIQHTITAHTKKGLSSHPLHNNDHTRPEKYNNKCFIEKNIQILYVRVVHTGLE